MNTKRLITASIFSLISASTALAADVLIPHQTAQSAPSSTIVAPTFSWTGLYLGVQAGGFSSKADMTLIDQEKGFPLDKEFSPKLSGFAGGFYAGSNIDLGDNFIFGVDTDLMLSGKKHTKTITIGKSDNVTVENAVGRLHRSAAPTLSSSQTATQTQNAASGSSVPAALPTSASGESAAPKPAAPKPAAPKPAASKPAASKPAASQPNQPQAGQVNPAPQTTTGAERPNQSDTISNSGNANSKTPGVSTPLPKTPSTPSIAQLGAAPQGERAVQSSPAQSVAEKPAAAAQPAAGASTRESVTKTASSVSPTQSSSSARTVPSGGALTLARSGSSNGSETKTSSGTSGAHGAHHSAHGSGHSNPHGASHPGGHGSGANPHGSSHGANSHTSRPHGAQSQQVADKGDASVYGIEKMKKMVSELSFNQEDEVETVNHIFKQNWGGATRVRIGFSADRFMPYLAGGIAYGQFQDTVSISVKGEDGSVVSSKNLTDETKTMIGYTLGGGVDFSVLDNVIVRAEYRYSDFGKKKFAKEKLEINYKTNDFRVGVAYKF